MAKNNRFSDDFIGRVWRPDGTEVPLSEVYPQKVRRRNLVSGRVPKPAEAPIRSKKPHRSSRPTVTENDRFSDDPVIRVRRPDGTEKPLSEVYPESQSQPAEKQVSVKKS